MKILDVLKKEAIIVGLQSRNKAGVIRELVSPVARIAKVDEAELIEVLTERERLGSTGIGAGIGIPHGKLKNLDDLVLGFGLSTKGVDFESIDSRPTYIFFLLVTPENSTGLHLKVLARISRILKDDPFRERLLQASDRDEVYAIIEENDEEF